MSSEQDYEPPTFALDAYPEDDEVPVVVAWGMCLPDGTVVTVGWCDGAAAAASRGKNIEHAAFIFDGDVRWIRPAA